MSVHTCILPNGTEIDLTTTEGLRLLDCEIATRLGWLDIYLHTHQNDLAEWRGTVSGSRFSSAVWPYSTDANLALQLFDMLPDDCTPRLVRMLMPRGDHIAHTWKGSVIYARDRHYDDIDVEADRPAVALCLAWMAYKDAEEAG